MKVLLSIMACFCAMHSLQADEGPVCHRCEKIREYNAAHPENNYYWYDDYLKDKEKGKEAPKEESKKEDNTPSQK